MRFRILGSMEVQVGGRAVDLGGPKQRAVLALLLLAGNRVVSLDRLIDQLWDGEPPPRATASLQAYLSNLRRILEPNRPPRAPATVLVTAPPGYVLRVAPFDLDAAAFETGVADGQRLLNHGRPAPALAHLVEALALWRGPALADFAFEPFAQTEIVRLEELRLTAIEDRLTAQLQLGEHLGAVPELEALIRDNPLRERFWGLLMLALYRSGRQGEALRTFAAARTALVEELGVEPGPLLRRLEADILAQAPSLEWAPADEPPAASAPTRPTPPRVAFPDQQRAPRRPYLGRAVELARLQDALSGVIAGAGGVVLVSGEAGIGKTRLVDELAARAPDGVLVARGGGYEGGLAPVFWLWGQVLRGVLERGTESEVHAALGPVRSELSQVVPEIAVQVEPPDPWPALDRKVSRFRLYRAVTDFLLGVAQHRPLLVVLDDLHWVDAPSLELLVFLAEQAPTAPILLVGTYRPQDVSAPVTDALAAMARAGVRARIELVGLTPAEVEAFIRLVTGVGPAHGVAAAVHRRTDGNPFFVGELVRLLESERLLAAEVDTAARRIPEGVRDVIRRRMARLPEQTNTLLTLAAVIGAEFDVAVLEEAAGLDTEAVFDLVESAVVSGMVVEEPAVPSRCRFSHALVQEAIYEELTGLRRARLHARVAHALERQGAADDGKGLAELARHFFLASAAGEAMSAAIYAVRAADAALASLGYEAAEAHLGRARQALDLLPAGVDRDRLELDVQVRLMRVLGLISGYSSDGVGRACARAQELSLRLGEGAQLTPVLWSQWGVHIGLADFAAADRAARQLVALGRGNDDPLALLGGLQSLGSSAVHQGDLVTGKAHLEEAVALADRLDDPGLAGIFLQHPAVFARDFLALAEWLLGDETRAQAVTEEALGIARAFDHPFTLTLALFFDAWLAVFARDAERAGRRAEASWRLAEEHGFGLFGPMARVLDAWARAQRDDVAAAATQLADALAALDATRTRMVRHFFLGLQAEVQWLAGDADEALRTVESALDEAAAVGERFYEAELHRLHGELLLAGSAVPTEDAVAALQRSVSVARAQQERPFERRALQTLLLVQANPGRRPGA